MLTYMHKLSEKRTSKYSLTNWIYTHFYKIVSLLVTLILYNCSTIFGWRIQTLIFSFTKIWIWIKTIQTSYWGSLSGRSINLVFITVKTTKLRDTKTEITKRRSIRMWEMTLFTSCAYSIEAKARTVSGYE